MSYSLISTAGSALSVLDLGLIIGVFLYHNRRINALENGSSLGSASGPVKSGSDSLEDRVISLENQNEILLQRLSAYDDLFMKILSSLRDRSLPPQQVLDATPKTVVEEIQLNASEDVDLAEYSFLK